jgi:hypothetical protein
VKCKTFGQFRDNLFQNLKERFKTIVCEKEFVLATILDPRTKLHPLKFLKNLPTVTDAIATAWIREELGNLEVANPSRTSLITLGIFTTWFNQARLQ